MKAEENAAQTAKGPAATAEGPEQDAPVVPKEVVEDFKT